MSLFGLQQHGEGKRDGKYSRASDKDHMAPGCVYYQNVKVFLLCVSLCTLCQDCAAYIQY